MVWENRGKKKVGRVKEERRVERKVMLANKRQEKKRSADFFLLLIEISQGDPGWKLCGLSQSELCLLVDTQEAQ